MDEITLFQIKPKHIAIAFAEIYTSDHMLKGQIRTFVLIEVLQHLSLKD